MDKRSNEELCLLAQQGDKDACAELLLQNEAYIVSLIRKLGFDYKSHMEDLMQCGYLGMLRAVEKFDPEKGYNFLTYATEWINKELREYLNKILGRPDEVDLSEVKDVPVQQPEDEGFRGLVRVNTTISSNPMEQAVIRKEQTELLQRSVKALAPREREFALHRYGLEEHDPMGREKMMSEYNIPMAEVKRLERNIHDFIRKYLSKSKVLAFEGDSIDPKLREKEAAAAYEKLFADPAGDYIHGLTDAFDEDWERAFPKRTE